MARSARFERATPGSGGAPPVSTEFRNSLYASILQLCGNCRIYLFSTRFQPISGTTRLPKSASCRGFWDEKEPIGGVKNEGLCLLFLWRATMHQEYLGVVHQPYPTSIRAAPTPRRSRNQQKKTS